jgi:16S rRNA (cytosine1402-N4)-methyltransferase
MYHTPVMLIESIRELNIDPKGIYVDLTFGGGGHAKAILKQLNDKGHLYAFDHDSEAMKQSQGIGNQNFTFFKSNACYLKYFLKFYEIEKVDGIFADLGTSSHQIDTPERGFSTRYNGPLDMRMNQNLDLSAHTVVNKYTYNQLQHILSLYGEIANASAVASAIIEHRICCRIDTTEELCGLLNRFTSIHKRNKYYAQVFQALRIEVNQELDVLQSILMQSIELLKPKGRLVMISYHSLEDRLVKRFMNTGSSAIEPDKDIYGNITRPLHPLYKKPLEPSNEEIEKNSRARSAKMRVAEKL